MDAGILKTVGSVVLWIGLFYLMMRYGCGAHMMGRHRHRNHNGATPGTHAKDPVCGMQVGTEQATAAGVHAGRTYYFCSPSCRDKFEQEPARYVGATVEAVHQH